MGCFNNIPVPVGSHKTAQLKYRKQALNSSGSWRRLWDLIQVTFPCVSVTFAGSRLGRSSPPKTAWETERLLGCTRHSSGNLAVQAHHSALFSAEGIWVSWEEKLNPYSSHWWCSREPRGLILPVQLLVSSLVSQSNDCQRLPCAMGGHTSQDITEVLHPWCSFLGASNPPCCSSGEGEWNKPPFFFHTLTV